MAAQDAGTSAGILPELDMGDATGIVSEMEAQEAGLWLALDILCVCEKNTGFGRAFLLRRLRNQVPANWKDLRVFSFCYCCAAAYSPPCGASFSSPGSFKPAQAAAILAAADEDTVLEIVAAMEYDYAAAALAEMEFDGASNLLTQMEACRPPFRVGIMRRFKRYDLKPQLRSTWLQGRVPDRLARQPT